MWHSGTLAAAKQAVLLGMKGIAFSTPVGNTEPDFNVLEPYVEETLKMLLRRPGCPFLMSIYLRSQRELNGQDSQ